MSRRLALTFADDRLRVVLLHSDQVEAAWEWPDPFRSVERTATFLKEQLRTFGIRNAAVGVTRTLRKEVRFPAVASAEEAGVVLFQARRDLVEPVESYVFDYAPLPGEGDQKSAAAYFCAKARLEIVRTILKQTGLRPLAIVPVELAVYDARDPRATLDVIVQSSGVSIAVRRASATLLTLERSVDDAEELASELRRVLLLRSASREEIVAIRLVGEATLGPFLESRLGIPVEVSDPLGSFPLETDDRSAFAPAVALARMTEFPVNFLEPRRPKSDRSRHRRRLILAGLAGAFLVGAGFLVSLEFSARDRRIESLTQERDQLDAEIASLEPDAKRKQALDDFTKREVVWLDELYDLADRLPKNGSVKTLQIEGSSIAQQKPTGKQPPKNEKLPIATLQLVLQSTDDTAAQRTLDAFKGERDYEGTTHVVAGKTEGGSKGQQHTIQSRILRRNPETYIRKLPEKESAR